MVPAIFLCWSAIAQEPFLSSQQWRAIREEVNGVAPYENLRYVTGLHRVPGTPGFEQAARFIVERARAYGLDDAHSEQFPIDGVKTYGLMRSYLAWNVQSGQLWEVSPQHVLIGDATTDPIRLADYSHSASVETSLIDVGSGTEAKDYLGKDVGGKIVLADGVLSHVQELAVAEHGAAGILSDMPNQTTAWSGLDPTLVRWGHLDARQSVGFAFMISRQTAEAFRSRLAAKNKIILKAEVKATVGPGNWTVDIASIAGSDSAAGQVVFSCHLDHERPGANDDGSGCVTILEVARALNLLIHSGALPRPKRTIRFIWTPEHEGTMAFLATHPDMMKELRANIHMDMVGGDPFKNKSIMHVTETPWSLPSFVTDVGIVFLNAIRMGAMTYAEGAGSQEEAIIENRVAENSTRNEFFADVTPFEEGSDHDDYDSSTIAVPSLYLRDWPDLYIHTDHDSLDKMDASKLRRVAALGAAAGYVYASLDSKQLPVLLPFLSEQSEARIAGSFTKAQKWVNEADMDPGIAWYEANNLLAQSLQRECATLRSLVAFTNGATNSELDGANALRAQVATFQLWLDNAARQRGVQGPTSPLPTNADTTRVPMRKAPFGPVQNQNDDALLARLGRERYRQIMLLNGDAGHYGSVLSQSGLYAYEILNFVDGKRTIGEVRDAVSAEYKPLSIDLVSDYLGALETAKIIEFTPGKGR